jgi:signal transduction histidine kinase
MRDKSGSPSETERIVAAGATDVLSKPVDEDTLRTRIRVAERAAVETARIEDEAAERAKVRAQLVTADRLSSMGTLAAGVAHEVNNPLASLTASLDFVEESLGDIEDAEVVEALSDARRSAERVTEIVGALSRFARAERTEAAPVDVEGVLDTIAQVLSNEIRHRAQLVRDYGGVSAAMADEGRLGQVFLNLIKNAADALPIGHVDAHQVKLRTREDGGYVVVEVSDTGPGVDPRIASRIFDPFFTTKPIGSGTGLGLSLCHGVISGLGGTIELLQGTAVGATFRVRLPVADEQQKGRERRRTPPSGVTRPIIGGRVLVVDDERLIRRSIKRTLIGHDVTLAENGKEALSLCLRNDYDVILCDLMMPEVSGMELYDRLVQARPELIERIVYMTGGAFTPEARNFLDRIDNIQLSKPFEVKELRSTIAAVVAERRRR